MYVSCSFGNNGGSEPINSSHTKVGCPFTSNVYVHECHSSFKCYFEDLIIDNIVEFIKRNQIWLVKKLCDNK